MESDGVGCWSESVDGVKTITSGAIDVWNLGLLGASVLLYVRSLSVVSHI